MRAFWLVLSSVWAVSAHKQTLANSAFLGELSRESLEATLAPSFNVGNHVQIKATKSTLRGSASTSPVVFSPSVPTIDDGGSITLSLLFSGSYTPSDSDYVTISCGKTLSDDDYLDSIKWNQTLSFYDLPFLRCDYEFKYISVESDSVHVKIAAITVPSSEPPTTPKQLHLNFKHDPSTTANVMFISSSTLSPIVKFGLTADSLSLAATGSSSTYTSKEFCDKHFTTGYIENQKWFRDPGMIHSVELLNLQPGTKYFYTAGNDVDGWTAVSSFTTAPPPGSPFKFVGFGDQGYGTSGSASFATAESVEREIVENGSTLTLHFGDLGYALGNARVWDMWGSMISRGASKAFYMVSPGNHELNHVVGDDPSHEENFLPVRSKWSNGECGVPLFHRFANPGTVSAMYYSFHYGNAFIIQMSSEHDWREGSKQHTWLVSELSAVDRTKYPWVIVTLHRPVYTTQEGENSDYALSRLIRLALDPVFHQYKVNIALTAHTHSYERTCEVYRGACVNRRGEERGTTFIVVGSAGAYLEPEGFSPKFGRFSQAHTNSWGYVRLNTGAGERGDQLGLEFVLDENGTVYDSVLIDQWL